MRWRELKTAIAGAGDMPIGLMLLIPRMSLSYSVIAVAMLARAIARVIGTASSIEGKANLRILIVTDYMPPQTHGIAIRFRQYINFMRRDGHEVHVFCTDSVKQTETSFDHPNLPSITNPYNSRNKMAYNAGVKLAWYLSAKQWDLVHVVCPSNICWAVLPVAAWRRIPIYVSHHVEMEYYIYEYVKMKLFADFGMLMYWLNTKLPCILMAQVNAAPTLNFLNSHFDLKLSGFVRHRIPSGVAAERFKVDSPEQLVQERLALLCKCGLPADSDACVLVMVQRLAPEKGTIRALEALATIKRTKAGLRSLDGKRPVHVLIAGDGPSRAGLTAFANEHEVPATFVGNIPNMELPPLYRAADVFVTCSTSETFGLTVLEALACGTPAVLPHCGVFDELWIGKVPDAWIYNEGVEGSILSSLRAAASPAAREYLAEHPVKASWEDATKELLGQYRELITANLPNRQVRASWLGKLDSLLRALAALMISLAVLYLSLRRSYRRAIQVWARLQGLWFVADMLSLLPDVPDVPDEPDKH